MRSACSVCGDVGDLRPYGKDGAPICFGCAMGTPERKREAERHFAGRLGFAGDVALLTEAGPVPAPEPVRRLVRPRPGSKSAEPVSEG